MMPGIIISFIFSKQLRMVLQTTPLQDEFACTEELLNNAPNWLGIEIGAENRPWSARNCLFASQQARVHQPFDRAATHSANASCLIQADSVRVCTARFCPAIK